MSESTDPSTGLLELARLLPKPTAFVFGGGGSWGALHWGILRALAETDIRPDLVVGTSVGSLNGAIAAADPEHSAEILGQLWPSVTREQIFPGNVLTGLNRLRRTHGWLYDNANLAEYLTSRLPVTRIEDLHVPFVAVATDFATGSRVELDHGDLATALLASSAIPGIFPWVDREGLRLVDGGVVSNVSTDVARARGVLQGNRRASGGARLRAPARGSGRRRVWWLGKAPTVRNVSGTVLARGRRNGARRP